MLLLLLWPIVGQTGLPIVLYIRWCVQELNSQPQLSLDRRHQTVSAASHSASSHSCAELVKFQAIVTTCLGIKVEFTTSTLTAGRRTSSTTKTPRHSHWKCSSRNSNRPQPIIFSRSRLHVLFQNFAMQVGWVRQCFIGYAFGGSIPECWMQVEWLLSLSADAANTFWWQKGNERYITPLIVELDGEDICSKKNIAVTNRPSIQWPTIISPSSITRLRTWTK
jgi:hypothetical protein